MRIGIAIYERLYDLAKKVDPARCLGMPSSVRRVYGLQTSGTEWRLLMMMSDGNNYVRGPFRYDLS
jgi:hypothetical protein